MKNLYFIMLIAFLFVACQSQPKKADEKQANANVQWVDVKLHVEGMHCTDCEQSIAKGVNELAGIDSISANHLDSTAFVRYDPSKTDLDRISKAIELRGYHVVGPVAKNMVQ